jgi:hypothetical protein
MVSSRGRRSGNRPGGFRVHRHRALWARRAVRRALEREQIVSTPDATPPNELVAGARAARSMAEVVRRNTADATGGRAYAEIDPYVVELPGRTIPS